jgi:ubiquinone/menaquinone biosynthesis C-methylase UbiE
MYKHSGFWNVIAKRYARQPVPDAAAYEKKLARTREFLSPDSLVFEFGCGTGSTAMALASHAKHILATDFSSKMIGIARDKARAAGLANLRFEQQSLDEINLPDASFDVVMGHAILHLLQDRNVAIAKAYRLLKPGGVFVSSTACLGGSMRFIQGILWLGCRLRLLPMVRFFTVDELTQSLIRAGFEPDAKYEQRNGRFIFIIAGKPG